ncbi:MAG: ABC transporter permease subunit [Deltaproteobacteria bacterium]|nr:ABC transporter permease subunit [Deltaproteobacteria bacterium]
MKNPVTASLGRMYAIMRNTFIEAYRNRAFVGLGIASVGLVVSSIALSRLAISDQASRVLVDFGLFSIALLEVVIAIVMGVILIFKEVDRKTFYLILPKPVRRSEVVAGKFGGLLLVLAVALLLMGLAWVLSLWSRGIDLQPDMFKALALVWMEAALITSVALFFSSFASPVLSGVFTFGVFLVGRSVIILDELLTAKKGLIVQNPVVQTIASFTVDVFPDLSVFNIGKEIIVGVPVGWDYVGGAGLYCAGYCLCFLALAMLIFRRRDFV